MINTVSLATFLLDNCVLNLRTNCLNVLQDKVVIYDYTYLTTKTLRDYHTEIIYH